MSLGYNGGVLELTITSGRSKYQPCEKSKRKQIVNDYQEQIEIPYESKSASDYSFRLVGKIGKSFFFSNQHCHFILMKTDSDYHQYRINCGKEKGHSPNEKLRKRHFPNKKVKQRHFTS